MTWWTDYSKYINDSDNLRLLAELFRIHLGDVIGQQIYPIVGPDYKIKQPYTINHNRRPEIVAILFAILEPNSMEKVHPASSAIAANIVERKTNTQLLETQTNKFVSTLTILLNGWMCTKSKRAKMDQKTRKQIHLFAETITRAGQMYRETLERNRIIWDSAEPGYVKSEGFNFAFDIHYIQLAAIDLRNREPPAKKPEIVRKTSR
jgi:hypothetical protein